MKALLLLGVRSAWNRRLSLGLTLLAVLLATTLLLSVERLRASARDSFAQSVSGTDLVVGARGSGVPLVLQAIFRLGDPLNTMSWASYQAIAGDPAVAWAVPLSLGDSHRGFPVVGTLPAYFEHYRHGDHQSLALAAGRVFDGIFEAVLGAEVAERLGYRPGESIFLSHGDGALPGMVHDDKPFTVVGILKPTGTPVDRAVHVGLSAIEAIHLDWVGGVPMPGFSIAPEQVGKFDLTPKAVTAVLLGLHQRAEVFRVQRRIQQFAAEPLTAVLPGMALDQLWQTLTVVEQALLGVSWLVLGVGLAGLMAVMLASLNERRREMAILRAVGAGPRHILGLLLLESSLVSGLGAGGGLLLTTALSRLAATPGALPGMPPLALSMQPGEWELLLAVLVCGVLVSLLPAWRAYRLSLADGLMPRL